MFEGQLLISIPSFSTLTIQGIKWVYRKLIIKDPEYDFPKIFYEVMLPFITAFWRILFGYIGWSEPVKFVPMEIAQWATMIIVTLAIYNLGLKSLATYKPGEAKEVEVTVS